MVEFARGDLGAFTQARKDLDALVKANPLHLKGMRKQQDDLCSFLLQHAEKLLDLALERLQSEQCESCRGYGRVYHITDCDSGHYEPCKDCSGTGKKPVKWVKWP